MTQTIPAAYLSRCGVLVDGQNNAGMERDLVSALVEETTEGLYRAEIMLTNFGVVSSNDHGYLYFGRSVLDFGKKIELRLGPGNPPSPVFLGWVTALEAEYPEGGGGRLTVLMEDRLQNLRMTRRTRSFEDVSDADVIAQIAREHGLTADVELNGPTHKSLAQVNLSDLAFIRERARACNGEVWAEDSTLKVRTRAGRNTNTLALTYGDALRAFRARADLAHQCTEFAVNSWDVAVKTAIREVGSPADVSSELAGDTGGSAILQQKFGERVASVVHTVALTSQEAQGVAKARYLERARRFVTGSGQCDGNTAIQVGGQLRLAGLGAMFDGRWYVCGVRHTYTLAQGFRTEFDVERPGIGQAR